MKSNIFILNFLCLLLVQNYTHAWLFNRFSQKEYLKSWDPNTEEKIRGSKLDLIKFKLTGVCKGCYLADFDLREPIKKLNKQGKKINLEGSYLSGANLSNTDLTAACLKTYLLKMLNSNKQTYERHRLKAVFSKKLTLIGHLFNTHHSKMLFFIIVV